MRRSMDDTLFLTLDEAARFNHLPAELRQHSVIDLETLNHLETDEQLEIRRQLASFKNDPSTVAFANAIAASQPVSTWPEVSAAVLPELYFTVGARGVTAMIGALLEEMRDAEDVDFLAALSFIRHELLGTNAATEPSASTL
jgi:hypothetical protein